jgi:hypothetical protein
MKRIAKLLLLAAFAALLAPTAQAAEYQLAVAGRQVTDANKDDILGDGGSVRFSLAGTNGTLTLSNAAITNVLGGYSNPSRELSGIVAVDAFALTIVLEGSNVVKAVPNTGIYANDMPLTITGGGSLWLVPNQGLGIVTEGDLTIDGVTVSAGASRGGGIECLGNLTITNADVTASNRDSRNGIECQRLSIGGASRLEATTAGTGDEEGKRSALWFKNGIEIGDGLVVLEPSPYWIDDNTIHAEGDSGADGALRVVIGPPVAYPLWVGGTQVTSANATNILGDGTASFEGTATNGTLYLSNARITEAIEHPGINTANIWSDRGFDLTISLSGSNRVECAGSTTHDYCVYAGANLAITGEGTLVAEIPNGNAGGIGGHADLRIDGATVTVSAGDTGLLFGNTLAISNATVTATGTSNYGIYCSGFNGRIDIADSVVTATGGSKGLYARGTGSSLAVSGSSVVTAVTTSDDNVAFSAAALVLGDGLAVTEPAGGVFREDGSGSGCVIDPATGGRARRVVIGPPRFAVTVEGGSTTNTTARAGENVTVVADDPEEGKAFVGWSADDAMDVTFATPVAATTTFEMPARAATVTATFKDILIDAIPDQEWTGSAVEPVVRVQLDGVDQVLFAGTDYTVSYTNNVDPGTATATVTMAPPRTGHASATFRILPPPEPPAVSNVVARQRWPWNGLVDVDYEVGGTTTGLVARISFAERGGAGRSWVATNFLAGAEPSAEPGFHRATWDTAADGVTNVVAAKVTATIELVRKPPVSDGNVWSLIGDFNSWAGDVEMTLTDGKWVSPVTKITAGGFKIRYNHDWTEKVGGVMEALGTPFPAISGGDNISIEEENDYVVTYDPDDQTILVEVIGWGVVGTINSWGGSADLAMKEENGMFVRKNVTLAAHDEIKVRYRNSWDVNYGGRTDVGFAVEAISGGDNLEPGAGTYDIWLDAEKKALFVMKAGEDPEYWGVVGTINGWGGTPDAVMYHDAEGYFVAKGITLAARDEIKIRKNSDWTDNRGASDAAPDTALDAVSGGDNIKVAAGTYDVYYQSASEKIYVMTAGKTPADAQ